MNRNEKGFVLVTGLLLLVLLTLTGLYVCQLGMHELHIAMNNRLQRQTFSLADGGAEVGAALLEENIACGIGFTGPPPFSIGLAEVTADLFGRDTRTLNFWQNESTPDKPYPSDTQRHVRIGKDSGPHTNIYFSTRQSLATGNAIQAANGYEGFGYGAGSGGGQTITTIDSQHRGKRGSTSTVWINWRHVIGQEATCRY